jgi:ArsR family transcriptional regulator
MKTAVQSITREELSRKLTARERVQLINVLEPEHDKEGMISGSWKIPLAQLDRRMDELDKSREVIVYCASYACPGSRQAAELLGDYGFNVKAYYGGLKEWKEAGLPTEAAETQPATPKT